MLDSGDYVHKRNGILRSVILTIAFATSLRCQVHRCEALVPSNSAIKSFRQHHFHEVTEIARMNRIKRSFQSPLFVLKSTTNVHTNSRKDIEFPAAIIVGFSSTSAEEERGLENALHMAGFRTVVADKDGNSRSQFDEGQFFRYKFSKATGMLQFLGEPTDANVSGGGVLFDAPKWVPIVKGEENVLVANGWSFLDPDESDPLSAFDIDAANEEGQYRPKWGSEDSSHQDDSNLDYFRLSSLGYNLQRLTSNQILLQADKFLSTDTNSRAVLLDGATDPNNIKITNNGWDFSGSTRREDIHHGVFTCAIGGLPLFTTTDLAPTTASSGWLSFVRPLSPDHVELLYPEKDAQDRRIEVICARSGCHLGHYFGRAEGYCINASALNFHPSSSIDSGVPNADVWSDEGDNEYNVGMRPVSWQKFELDDEELSPSERILKSIVIHRTTTQEVLLGAGCFWHVEFALRRLPGIVSTSVGYAGGDQESPTYEQVCKGSTGHAEVVKVTFDPHHCPPEKLFDCFLAMHDPTMIRSHGKRARGTGQYRSCIFVRNNGMEYMANSRVEECRLQLGKMLSTEVRCLKTNKHGSETSWYWEAEERHQRHDERVKKKGGEKTKTLSIMEWLREYGRRSSSVWGSTETFQIADDYIDAEGDDDGMARLMI